jgi:hypothetical protein
LPWRQKRKRARSWALFLGSATVLRAKLILAKLLLASTKLISKLPGDYIGNRGRSQNPARFVPKPYQHSSRFKMPAWQNELNRSPDRTERK